VDDDIAHSSFIVGVEPDAESAQEPDDEPKNEAMDSRSRSLGDESSEASLLSDSSLNTSVIVTMDGDKGGGGIGDSFQFMGPRPGEDSIQRCNTMLHHLEINELNKPLNIVVPEGMGENRRVNFVFENKMWDIQVPDCHEVGSEVQIVVPKRPPLERNRAQANCREHMNFPDFVTLWNMVRHPPQGGSGKNLQSEEAQARMQQYHNLYGRSMQPLLPYMPEEQEGDLDSDE